MQPEQWSPVMVCTVCHVHAVSNLLKVRSPHRTENALGVISLACVLVCKAHRAWTVLESLCRHSWTRQKRPSSDLLSWGWQKLC